MKRNAGVKVLPALLLLWYCMFVVCLDLFDLPGFHWLSLLGIFILFGLRRFHWPTLLVPRLPYLSSDKDSSGDGLCVVSSLVWASFSLQAWRLENSSLSSGMTSTPWKFTVSQLLLCWDYLPLNLGTALHLLSRLFLSWLTYNCSLPGLKFISNCILLVWLHTYSLYTHFFHDYYVHNFHH